MVRFFCKKHIVFFFIALIFISILTFTLVKITSNAKGKDLNGRTIYVEESGTELNKYCNGEIIVNSSFGPGLLILKDCHDISLELNSNVYLLLDNKTSITDLNIKSNAHVDSLEAYMFEQTGKQVNEPGKRPHINKIEIYRGFSPIIKNIDFKTKRANFSGNKLDNDNKKLKIAQDTSFEGLGVRLLIENVPATATNVYIVLVENGVERQIDWFAAKDDRSRFYSGFYDYRFLDAGENYTFRFYYQDDTNKIVEKSQVNAVPLKGKSVKFDKSTAKIKIDEKNGVISWDSLPISEMPEGTQLVYNMISYGKNQSWNFVGQCVISPADFDSINIYNDMRIYEPQNIYDNKVFLSIFFCYESYRWPILDSVQFNVHF